MSKKIVSGDPEYALVFAAWLANGSPAQFDITYFEDLGGGQEGGAIFNVREEGDTVIFYMRYSKGPTLFDENSASERPSQRGWLLLSQDHWKSRYSFDHRGKFHIRQDDAPNELA